MLLKMEEIKQIIVNNMKIPTTTGYTMKNLSDEIGKENFIEIRDLWFQYGIILMHRGLMMNDDRNGFSYFYRPKMLCPGFHNPF